MIKFNVSRSFRIRRFFLFLQWAMRAKRWIRRSLRVVRYENEIEITQMRGIHRLRAIIFLYFFRSLYGLRSCSGIARTRLGSVRHSHHILCPWQSKHNAI